ncbi:hypothetical protein Pst134EB_001226 [Puccinia striiformis f. sp. tritici]|nr:hypothetical protein Pst134EB_001226 [Puccinia striiformis f. sp. tritici]
MEAALGLQLKKRKRNNQASPESETRNLSSDVEVMAQNNNNNNHHNQTQALRETLRNNFKFIILQGPAFHSKHQALRLMVKSAQNLLEEDPDDDTYQTELDEQSAKLKSSEQSIDSDLSEAAVPVVDSLAEFIQTLIDREVKSKIDDHSIRFEKKIEKRLRNFQSKPSGESTTTTTTTTTSSTTEIDRKLIALEKKNEILENKLKEIEINQNQLQLKLKASEANQIKPQNTVEEQNPSSPSKPASPDTTRTPANAFSLALSPQIGSTITTQPPPAKRHRSSSQTQTQPKPQNKSQQRPPHAIKIPARVSTEPGLSSPRTNNELQIPFDSPVNQSAITPTNSQLQFGTYNYVMSRLMNSTSYSEYLQSKYTELLDQLGLNKSRINELINFCKILPDLDLSFLSKTPLVVNHPNPNPITGNNNNNHHLPPHFHNNPNHQQIQLQSNQINPINALPPTPTTTTITTANSMTATPSNINVIENLTLPLLKDHLKVIQFHTYASIGRLDKLETGLANSTKFGVNDPQTVSNLLKRIEFVERQTSQLVKSKATSQELIQLKSQLEGIIAIAQQEAQASYKAFCADTTTKVQSLSTAPVPVPNPPPTNQNSLTMVKVENQILDRLYVQLDRLFKSDDANRSTNKATTSETSTLHHKEREKSELEEGETSGSEEQEFLETIESSLTGGGGDTPEDFVSKKTNDLLVSSRWKTLIEKINMKLLEQQKFKENSLIHDHQHHHHHHQDHNHHHHHHHRVRMFLGLTGSSSIENCSGEIDCLKINKDTQSVQIDPQNSDLLNEQRKEEIQAEQNLVKNSIDLPPLPKNLNSRDSLAIIDQILFAPSAPSTST